MVASLYTPLVDNGLPNKTQEGALKSRKLTNDISLSDLEEKIAIGRHVGPPLSVMLVEEYYFQNTSVTVVGFAKLTNNAQVEIGSSSNQLHPHVSPFENKPGIKIVIKTFLPKEWSETTRTQSVPKLRSEINNSIQIMGIIFLFRRIGNLYVRVWFGTVRNLPAEVLLGTPYINRSVCGIFLGRGTVVPLNLRLVSIITRLFVESKRSLLHLKPSNIASAPYNAFVRIAK